MPNSTVPAAAEGLPKDPLAPRGSMSCGIDMAALRKMSMKELHDIRDVLHTLAEVISGFCCQPRFSREEENSYNDAGSALERIAEFLNSYEQAAVNVAVAEKPVASKDVEWRGWTILGFEADMADDLAPFAVLAAEAVRDEAEAKFREEHRRRAG